MLEHYLTVPVAATAQEQREGAATCPVQPPARGWLPAEDPAEPRACLGTAASVAKARTGGTSPPWQPSASAQAGVISLPRVQGAAGQPAALRHTSGAGCSLSEAPLDITSGQS